MNPELKINYSTVLESWKKNSIKLVEKAKPEENLGFRKPQLAAIHSSLAHLLIDPKSTATVVMPTGTGKTDTTAAIIIGGKFTRTLVIVPSDALRTQTAEKLRSLSTLRKIKAIDKNILSPIVTPLSGNISQENIDSLQSSNIVVTTPSTIDTFSSSTLENFTKIFSHLIIDEAHHAAAKTWKKIKASLPGKPCIQFTATPFREDGKSIDGKIIYNYPLSEAQKDGYFQKIEFHPVREYNPDLSDSAIAEKAVNLLRDDLKNGKDHILIARASTQKKAEEIFHIYSQHSDLNPAIVHSKSDNKEITLARIKNKEHKIIVCVDMLGEGFDLPELKVAALHDQHKSPNITLQFIGRLTRTSKNLGNSKFIANIANQKTEDQISSLYKESSDWGKIIKKISNEKIEKQIKKENFISGFSGETENSNLFKLNPTPKISATTYRVKKDNWNPDKVDSFFPKGCQVEYKSISDDKKIIIVALKHEGSPDWARTAELKNTTWYLLIASYNEDLETLSVHCSGNEHLKYNFINSICDESKKIRGESIFRTLHNINRLKIQNVGLSRARRNLRFTMHVGTDINDVISEIEKGTSKKSNIFSTGFEEGEATSIGCSHKGKIWEMNSDSIDYWVDWCDTAAKKINDESITIENILKNTMRAVQIKQKWPENITFIDWPESIKIENERKTKIIIEGEATSIEEAEITDLKVASPTKLSAKIRRNEKETSIEIQLKPDGFNYRSKDVDIIIGTDLIHLDDYLNENPLFLMTNKGEIIDGNYRYFCPASINTKIPLEQISTWDWSGVNINKESMGESRNKDTVQWHTYDKIKDNYEIVFNDDGSGEIADLVCINEENNRIYVDLFHCKYMNKKDKPGARVSDIDVVAGQAVRSLKWSHNAEKIFSQLLRRYQNSITSNFDRVLKGSIERIDELRLKGHHCDVIVNFNIVQPGVKKSRISDEQLTILGSCFTYIKDTTGNGVKVICQE